MEEGHGGDGEGGGGVSWWRGRTGREVRGDALDGVTDVGGRVGEDVQ